MKIPQEFTFSVKEMGLPNIVITGLNGMEIISNITYLIHYVYGRLKGIDLKTAEAFRDTLLKTLLDDRSPVWDDVEDTPGATEIAFTIPRNKDETYETES